MKSLLLKMTVTFGCLILWAGVANAAPIFVGDTNDLTTATDQYKQVNNDKEDNVNALVDLYNSGNDPDLPSELTLLGKWEVDEKRWVDVDENRWSDDFRFSGTFSTGGVKNEETGIISGTWSAPTDAPTGWLASDPIYYSLKAADHFALYYANGDTSGTWEIDWTTGNNDKIPELSHISFWTAKSNSTNQVPEPGTLALVGLGLATIAGYRRKRHSR